MTANKMIDISSGARHKKHTALWAVLAVILVLGAVGGFFGRQFYTEYRHQQEVAAAVDVNTFYPGITVQGIDLGGKTMEQAQEAVKALEPSLRGNYEITVKYGDKSWKLTQDDLNFTFDTDSVLKEAYAYARDGSPEDRYQKVIALRTTPKTYEIANTMSYDGVEAKLQDMVKGIAYAPVDATVASFDTATATFQYADGKNGLSVDENRLYREVEQIINGPKTGTVEVPTAVVPFNKTIAEVKSHLQKLGTYSTVSTNNANGTFNMARALAAVNGTCIKPGAVFSFNGTTGNCDKANGYKEAGAILNGQLIQSYGGGICQASTTIYGAALRSNLVIVQRSNHSIPSVYCPLGQDAAVSYPELDLKLKNPTDYPIYIVTSTKDRTLTATFYGYQSPDYDRIDITSQKTETIAAPTAAKYTVDKSLSKGAVKLTSKARTGYRATAQRLFYKNGTLVKTENLPSSYYRPNPAYYSIGPGTTVSGQTSSSAPASSKPAAPASSKAPQSSASSAASSAPQSSSPAQPETPDSGSNEGIIIPE
jgi:Uncharacterized vancomycin resistance protein